MRRAFESMTRHLAALSPEQRQELRDNMQAQIDAMRARGTRLVVNPTGHRVTLAATGPVSPLL